MQESVFGPAENMHWRKRCNEGGGLAAGRKSMSGIGECGACNATLAAKLCLIEARALLLVKKDVPFFGRAVGSHAFAPCW